VLAVPGEPAALLPVRPDPPIGTADDPPRRCARAFIPPGALLCCFTDGLVERRDNSIDQGIGTLAAVLDERIAAAAGPGPGVTEPAEDACAAVMRALVGSAPAPDDIAVLVLSRHPGPRVP
jgi:serine phosphatase RsbU (regulator of sigma subunit)